MATVPALPVVSHSLLLRLSLTSLLSRAPQTAPVLTGNLLVTAYLSLCLCFHLLSLPASPVASE